MITIILPIRDEGSKIRLVLDSILAQDYIQDQTEVLIADGLSSDETREIIREYQERVPYIYLIDNPGRIVPTGMNLALAQTKGNIIIRVDGHCVIAPDYVSKCVKHLVMDHVDGVGGAMETIGETPLSETISLAMSSQFGVGNSSFRTTVGKTILVDTIPFPAYTRAIIERVGLYDEELVRNQDDEYNYRIREMGGKLLLADDVRSKYYSRASLWKLWMQYFQYGFYKVRVLQKHPKQMSFRQFVPPLFVLGLLLSFCVTLSVAWGWIFLALIVGIYLAANFGATVTTAFRKSWRHLPLLPVCFAILHTSYGVGFLCGLFNFWNRWNDKKGKVPTFNIKNA